MSLPRMRTIPITIEYLKTLDPDTALNEGWLRHQIKIGLISCHKAGKRFLIDLDALEQYLGNPPLENQDLQDKGKVRKISDR